MSGKEITMKHIITLLIAAAAFFGIVGCSTPYKITSYDEKGNITSVAEGEKDVIDKITAATQDKMVLAWSNGWAAYVKMKVTETESGSATPFGEIYAGKMSKGYLSIPKAFKAQGIDIPLVVAATHENIAVGLTGISSASDNAKAATSSSGSSVNGGTVSTSAATTNSTTTSTDTAAKTE